MKVPLCFLYGKYPTEVFETKKAEQFFQNSPASSKPSLNIIVGWANVITSVKWDLTRARTFTPFTFCVHMQLYEWTRTHTHDSQWVEMKDLEFHPVTLCSRWRSGQARPGRSQERRSEREGGNERRWGRCRKKRGKTKLFFFVLFFFTLKHVFVFSVFLIRVPHGLLVGQSPTLHFSAPLSSPPPFRPAEAYTWAQPRSPRPQLTCHWEQQRPGRRWEWWGRGNYSKVESAGVMDAYVKE